LILLESSSAVYAHADISLLLREGTVYALHHNGQQFLWTVVSPETSQPSCAEFIEEALLRYKHL